MTIRLVSEVGHAMNGTLWEALLSVSLTPTSIAIIAYILLITFGLLGNFWVIWKVGLVLLFSRPLKNVTVGSPVAPKVVLRCIFVICLADLIVLATLSLLVDNLIRGYWGYGYTLCKIFYGVEVLNKFVIPLALVQISRISYAAAASASPKAAAKRIPLFAINLLTVSTFLMLLFCVVRFSSTTDVVMPSGATKNICGFDPPFVYGLLFNGAAFIVGYVLTVLYVYFYISVPVILKRRSSQSSTRALMRINQTSIGRIRRTVVAFVLIYLVCWTPYWIVFWLTSLISFPRWLINLSLFAHWLPYASCAAYPIMLTCINDGIHIAHTTVINKKKKQLHNMRDGVVQILSQMTVFQSATVNGATVIAPRMSTVSTLNGGDMV